MDANMAGGPGTRVADVAPTAASPVSILSIDGGGLRGLIPALILQRIEAAVHEADRAAGRPCQPLARHFDLIAGTSTGALLAVGLSGPGADGRPLMTTDDLVDVYARRGQEAFPRTRWVRLKQVVRPAYDQQRYRAILQEILGDLLLSELRTPVLLPGYDIRHRTARFFSSASARVAPTEDYHLRHLVRALTAAPIFFPPVEIRPLEGSRSDVIVDGALFANNPALCALTHALSGRPMPRPQLLISIGTGQANRKLPLSRLEAWGAMRWLDPRLNLPLIDAMLDGQVDSVDHHLAAFFARDDSYFRFDPHLPETMLAMDDASPAAVSRLVELTERYLEEQAGPIASAARRLVARIEAQATAPTAADQIGTG
ncbi:MAG: patatin-like phospholipase family protein [Pseudomonadota bacterium]|nr:patatin-like phospholipase family protein [Pseudomonadota bacterium]